MKPLTGWTRRLWRSTRGAALVEMSIILPVLLILFTGFVEFGRALHHNHVIDKSARDAARFLARQPTSGAFETDCSVDPPAGSALEQAKHLAIYGSTADTGEPLISYWEDGSGDPRYATVCVEGPDDTTAVTLTVDGETFTVRVVRVNIELAYDDAGLLGFLDAVVPGATLTGFLMGASHEERHIGE